MVRDDSITTQCINTEPNFVRKPKKFKMMLKTITFLFFLAVCAALPVDEPKDLEGVQLPPLDPQGKQPSEDGSDLKTDSTFWGYYGYHDYPIRRSYYTYGPSYYYRSYYPTYRTYWGSYW